jgi:hypothetical protein
VVAALAFLFLGLAAPPLPAQLAPQRDPWVHVERYHFEIKPKTPVKDLLPAPPRSAPVKMLLVDDLALVPEVQLQQHLAISGSNNAEREEARVQAVMATAHQVAKINFLNGERMDGFVERLLESRPDLAGLPFTLGEACRLTKDHRDRFRLQIFDVRSVLAETRPDPNSDTIRNPTKLQLRLRQYAEAFWNEYDTAVKTRTAGEKPHPLEERCAVAALTQVLGPESQLYQLGLVQRLEGFTTTAAGTAHSTQALAGLALFAPDDATRRAATDALRRRDPAAVAPHLLRGLRYPWPAVARNAADAIVRLGRADLTPALVQMLDEPDPRAPAAEVLNNGGRVTVVRELVRINHHRNCLLCHAPANTPEMFGDVVKATDVPLPNGVGKGVKVQRVALKSLNTGSDMAPVLIPGTPFPPPSSYYSQFRTPDILVRADVTYLRQDFSVMQKVPNAAPWPELQRFDFLVRTRTVTEQEAAAYRAEFTGQDNPYHEVALDALRLLTGRDAGTTAQEWRATLQLP